MSSFTPQFGRGVDASFLPEMIHDGPQSCTVRTMGWPRGRRQRRGPRAWMRDQGVNVVRLRVWHDPLEGLHSSWLEVVDDVQPLR